MKRHVAALVLIVVQVIALIAEMPWLPRPARAHLLQALVIALFAFLAARESQEKASWRESLRGVLPWLCALIAWCVFLVVYPPSHSAGDAARILQPFAIGELLRMLLCAGVYYAASRYLREDDVWPVLFGVLGVGTLVSFYGFTLFGSGSHPGDEMTSVFGNHEQFGSYLMLLLPIPLAVAISYRDKSAFQIASQVIAVIIGSALIVARTRSAWLGGLTGALVLLALNLRFAPPKIGRANKYLVVGPLLILSVAFGGLIFSDQLAPILSQRAGTFAHLVGDVSLTDRLRRWKAACAMTAERPLTGWGLGAFPVIQQRFTGEGDAPDVVVRRGTGHSNLAHNFWAQWASETGAPGLLLYFAAMAAGIIRLTMLASRRRGQTQVLLIGVVATIAATMVDMVGAPSYTFPGVSLLPWLWLGLGETIAQRCEQDDVAPEGSSVPTHVAAAVLGIAAAAVVLLAGRAG